MVTMYVRFPLSLRNVEDLLFERGIHLGHEALRLVEPVRSDARRDRPTVCPVTGQTEGNAETPPPAGEGEA